MTQVLPLGTLACLSTVQTLLQYGDDSSQRLHLYLVARLQTDRFTAVSEKILQRLRQDHPQKLTNQLLLILAPPSLRQLSLAKCSSVTALGIEKVLKRCRKLETLDLTDCNHLMHPLVFKVWDNLTCNMTSVSLESTTATDAIVHVILCSMPRLHHLNLSMCSDITDNAFLFGPTDHNKPGSLALTSVDLSGCGSLTNVAVKHLTEASGQSLRNMNLSWTEMSFLVLVYLAGYTLPTELQQDDMTSLHTQLTELIQQSLESMPCTTEAMPPCSTEAMPPCNTEVIPPCSTEAMPPCSTEAMPPCSTKSMPPCSTKAMPHCNTEAMPPCSTEAMPPCSTEAMPPCSTEATQQSDRECMKCDAEQYQHPAQYSCYKPELSEMTVEDDGSLTESIDCLAANSLSQKEDNQYEAEGNVNRDYTCENKGPGEQVDSDTYNPSSAVDGCVNNTLGLVFKAELVPYLTFTYSTDGVTSHFRTLTTTPPSSLSEKEAMSSSDESSVSDVDSAEECRCNTQIRIKRSYKSRLKHIDLKCIEDTSSQTLARLCLRFFFLATGSSLHNVALSWKRLDDSMLQFIATHAPNLRTVSLTDCDMLTKVGVSSLCTLCPYLEHINLQGVCFIGDGALVAPSIQTLSLAETDITDVTLQLVANTSTAKLKALDISWCEEVTTEGVNAVAENCVNLEKLAVRQGPITEQTLLLLAQHCRRIRVLNLSGITSITDSDLVMLSLRLKDLEELDVSWNCSLSDVGVHPILRHCVSLTSLVLSGIKVLTSEPFLHIISGLSRWRKCQALLRLKLHERNVLQEADMEQLSSDEEFDAAYVATRSTSYAPSLRWLDLEYCDKINDTHLAEIVAVCRGTLKVRDYYGEDVEPAWITCRKGSVYLAKAMS